MAMSRLERWTREVLEMEARKRGIRDVEVRSRGELVRAILRHDYASPQRLRSARKWVGALLDTAAAALPGRVGEQPKPWAEPSRRPSRPSAVARNPDARAPAATNTVPVSDPGAALPRNPQVRAADASAEKPSDPAEVAAAGSGTAAQLPSSPGEPSSDSTSGAAAVSSTGATRAGNAFATPGPERDTLEFTRSKPGELRLSWRISDQGSAGARAVLNAPGELTLRLVSVRTDPTAVVCSEITEHGPVAPSGEWALQLATPSTHCVTSVGLRSGDRFVSIVHVTSRPE